MKVFIRFSGIRFAVQMFNRPFRTKTFIAYFNSEPDADAFRKYCIKAYPDLQFKVVEFDN